MKLPPILSIIALSANILESNAQTDCLDICENYSSYILKQCARDNCGAVDISYVTSDAKRKTSNENNLDDCWHNCIDNFSSDEDKLHCIADRCF